ncbi:hypothetical protein J132_10792, partial [Termitomyces sp. J132]
IGAVAMLYCRFKRLKVVRKCLGKEEDHTVFKKECVGQVLEMELLRGELKGRRKRRVVRKVMVGTNNQVEMLALQDSSPGMGCYLINQVLEGTHRIRKTGLDANIGIFWTPRHHGIASNKQADKEVKKVAEGNKTGMEGLHFLQKPLPKSRAAIVIQHKKAWCREAQQTLAQSLRFKKAKAIDPNLLNAMKIIATLVGLPHKHASLLVQLCTGHCLLN